MNYFYLFPFLHITGSGNALVQANQEIRIATAMFPNLSLLNHSCCPNTSLTFSTGTSADPPTSDPSPEGGSAARRSSRGVSVTVRAAEVISAGQEILHCYGEEAVEIIDWSRPVCDVFHEKMI